MTAVAAASTPDEAGPHWASRSAFSFIAVAHYFCQMAILVSLYYERYWLVVPLALVCSHFMHGLLIGFHEASHGCLKKNRRFNEIEGLVIGTMSFMSFTLYRVAHQTHHAHLGTERDEELWPFVDPGAPRWARVLAAGFELGLGVLFTPFLFFRAFVRKGSMLRSPRIRKRVWKEFAAIAIFWTLALAAVAYFDAWRYFLWMFVVPAFVAGNLQSWRKYIEHVGLTGSTIRSGTRSIVADGWVGRLVSFTLLHEPYHGVHHLHVGLPHAELPGKAGSLAPERPDEIAPFPSYRHALLHLLKCLRDPKVGAQWHT
ncbi:hypothetical protein BH23VER1_BH23VER1_14900 [soil metagenome]